ncbi:hypothetical protein [Plantactinospora sp. CA-290183]|uniref:hypothetical protein n=1 Tax=Plantactinospora sp. CA-290183 TaxID=3240006 RepID=UPI003D8B82AC
MTVSVPPVDPVVFRGLSLLGHTIECIPQHVEILVATRKVQCGLISHADEQTAVPSSR